MEQIPKNFDFGAQVDRVSQVVSFDSVMGFMDQRMTSIDDSMTVTGLRMTSNTQNQTNAAFPGGGAMNPNATYTSDTRNPQGTAPQPQITARSKQAFRSGAKGVLHERKPSVGDSSNSPFPNGIVGNRAALDPAFRHGANLSKQTQNSVIIVD